MTTKQPTELVYQSFTIRKDAKGLVNLTDMWKAAGSPPHKYPALWLRTQLAIELVEALTSIMRGAHIIETHRGRWGGTWVIPNLAIAYAKHLSPHFHTWRKCSNSPPKYLCRPDLDLLVFEAAGGANLAGQGAGLRGVLDPQEHRRDGQLDRHVASSRRVAE
jgi:hypothetical protein